MSVTIITDDAAVLSPDLKETAGNKLLVAAFSIMNNSNFLFYSNERQDGNSERFSRALAEPSKNHLTTAQPSPADYLRLFRQAIALGARSIVCITISGKLSGSYDSAHLAKQLMDSNFPIYLVDSRFASSPQGWLVNLALNLSNNGIEGKEIAKTLEQAVSDILLIQTADNLDYLKARGRLGKASVIAASTLNTRPIVGLIDGEVGFLAKVRYARLYQKMIELAAHFTSGRKVKIGFTHTDDPERIQLLAKMAHDHLNISCHFTSEQTWVLAANTGPQTFGMGLILDY